MMKKIILRPSATYAITLCFMVVLAACSDQKWDDHYAIPDFVAHGTNFDLLSENPEYSTFIELLAKTELDKTIKNADQHTVLAVKNDALADFTGKSNEELKKILSMHIMPSAIFSNDMASANKISVEGKVLKFRKVSDTYTVNGIAIMETDLRTQNGVVHVIDGVIIPLPTIYEIIQTHPDLSLFKHYLSQDVDSIIHAGDNIIVEYDSIGKPIFREPVVYRIRSPYLDETLLADDTTVLSTVFLPTDKAVKQALTQILIAKNNDPDLVIPNRKYKAWNVDTIAGGRFFRMRDGGYAGDTICFLNNYFRNIVVRGDIPPVSSSSTYTSILNRTLQVSSNQVKSGTGMQEAGNGYYYLMDDITVPDMFYRQEFWFTPFMWITPTTWVQNSANITYTNGANYETRVEKPVTGTSNVSFTGHVARYNLARVGGSATFIIPFVLKGAYNVHVSYFPEGNVGKVDVKYGDQVLITNWNTSTQFNSRALCSVDTKLGVIMVANHGPVGITVENVNTHPISFPQHKFTLEYVRLVPVEE